MTRTLVAALAVMLLLAPVLPFMAVGSAAAAPAGMATIPDGNVAEDVPSGETIPLSASALEGGVLASDHADSLDIVLTTADHAPTVMNSDSAVVSGDGMALVLRDDQQSAGREVALDAGQLQEALGYKPQAIRGTHEDGSTWTASAEYVDGYLIFDVPHFSSNTVTFRGNVVLSASRAADDASWSYNLNDLDSVSDPTVKFSGVTNSHWDNVSISAQGSDGLTTVHTVAGNAPATDESVTVTGKNISTRNGYISEVDTGKDLVVAKSNTDNTDFASIYEIKDPPEKISAISLNLSYSGLEGSEAISIGLADSYDRGYDSDAYYNTYYSGAIDLPLSGSGTAETVIRL